MTLLEDIQSALIADGPLSPIILKLRLLSARLGVPALDDWIRHESDGYPQGAAVPEYRKIPVSYTASFVGPLGARISNQKMPSATISNLAGEEWNEIDYRDGVAAMDSLLESVPGHLTINASNLILLIGTKYYHGYNCIDVTGAVAASVLAQARHAIKSRLLEFTIELERASPSAAAIAIGVQTPEMGAAEVKTISQITQNMIYGKGLVAPTETADG